MPLFQSPWRSTATSNRPDASRRDEAAHLGRHRQGPGRTAELPPPEPRVDGHDVVHVGIAAQDRLLAPLDHPRQLGPRPPGPQRAGRRERMDDVSERRELHQRDAGSGVATGRHRTRLLAPPESGEDLGDHVPGRVRLRIPGDRDPAARGEHRRALGHRLRRVVGPLRVDRRAEERDRAASAVSSSKTTTWSTARSDATSSARSAAGMRGRPGPLRRRTAASAVDAHDQEVAQRARPLEVAHVPHVEEVEAPVGEHHAAAGGSRRLGHGPRPVKIEHPPRHASRRRPRRGGWRRPAPRGGPWRSLAS